MWHVVVSLALVGSLFGCAGNIDGGFHPGFASAGAAVADAVVISIPNWLVSFGVSSGAPSIQQVVRGPDGSVYKLGCFSGTAGLKPTGETAPSYNSNGSDDAFLTKLSDNGVHLWTITFGGTQSDCATSVSFTAAGAPVLVGYFRATTDLDPGPGTVSATSAGSWGTFVSSFSAEGELLWAKTFTGAINGTDAADPSDVLVTADGGIVVAGSLWGTVDFNPDIATTLNRTSNGHADIFYAKLSSSGTLLWAYSFGSWLWDAEGVYLVQTRDGNIYSSGQIKSAAVNFAFSGGSDILNLNSVWDSDVFFLKMTQDGVYQWAKSFGGTNYDYAWELTMDAEENFYLAGSTSSASIDFDFGATSTDVHTSAGGWDAYVMKINHDGTYGWTRPWGSTGNEFPWGAAVSPEGVIYAAGSFTGTTDVSLSAVPDTHTSAGSDDGFLVALDTNGNQLGARTWGGTGSDGIGHVTATEDERMLVLGWFSTAMDFSEFGDFSVVSPQSTQDRFILHTDDLY